MPQDFTLHTHSIGFDGRNTVIEMVARAADLGFKTIGISNHFILHPEIKKTNFYPHAVSNGYPKIYNSNLNEIMALFVPHYRELSRVADTAKIRVLRGAEVDFFNTPDWRRDFERATKILRPDYFIGSCHFVSMNNRLYNVHDIAHADSDAQDKMLTQYWKNIQAAASTGLFSWMAHLDLPKKVGIGKSEKWSDLEQETIECLAKHNVAIEINTSFEAEPYPSPRILNFVAKNNVPVLFSDDAHRTEQIGRRFDDAARLCVNCGINNFFALGRIK